MSKKTQKIQDLPFPYTLWITQTKENHIMDASEYENSLKKICDIENFTEFFQIYQYLQKPSLMPLNTELFFFKKNIKPVWENKFNRGGGKFIIRVKTEFSDLAWEKILIDFLKNLNANFCGIVFIKKRSDLVISIWTKELEFFKEKEEIKNWIRNVFGISDSVYIHFKDHPFTEDITPLEKDWDKLLKIAKNDTYNNI